MRSVGRKPPYKILISDQPVLTSRLDDLRFDPTVCPVLRNLPFTHVALFLV